MSFAPQSLEHAPEFPPVASNVSMSGPVGHQPALSSVLEQHWSANIGPFDAASGSDQVGVGSAFFFPGMNAQMQVGYPVDGSFTGNNNNNPLTTGTALYGGTLYPWTGLAVDSLPVPVAGAFTTQSGPGYFGLIGAAPSAPPAFPAFAMGADINNRLVASYGTAACMTPSPVGLAAPMTIVPGSVVEEGVMAFAGNMFFDLDSGVDGGNFGVMGASSETFGF